MIKELKYVDGTSDKFWKIETTGTKYTVTYGRNGTPGTSQTKEAKTEEECEKIALKLIAEKTKKGYSDTGEVSVSVNAIVKTPSGEKVDLQAIFDEYDLIIKKKNTKALVPFLEEKIKGNVTHFKKHVKKCKTYWMTYVDMRLETNPNPKKNQYNWEMRGDEKQQNIISLTAIAVMDKTEIRSWDNTYNLLCEIESNTLTRDVVLWAKPNWLAEFFLAQFRQNEWWGIGYYTLRFLEEKELISFEPELYALALASNMEYRSKIKPLDFIKRISEDKLALERDVPLLFDYPTNLQNNHFGEGASYSSSPTLWGVGFRLLLKEEKLNRDFLIEKILQIQTKDWNNNLKVFFRKFLDELAITSDELVQHQDTLFPLLQFSLSAIVSYAVEKIKDLHEHPLFKINEFLEWVEPVLMREDCKTTIKKLVVIYDKLSKNNPTLNARLASQLADVFLILDMSLQERIAKSIVKIGDKKDSDLKDKLSMYIPQMQGDVKEQLKDFLSEVDLMASVEDVESYQYNPKQVFVLKEEVTIPTDWNEILFQFGKFMSSEEVIDAELLWNVFAAQRHLLPEDYSKQLQPYLKQFNKKFFTSEYKEVTKWFLIPKITDIHQKFHREHEYNKLKTLDVAKQLVKQVEVLIEGNKNLPLLCLPTHLPHWVAPKTLLERIIAYQEAKEDINLTDLAIGIARMPRERVEEALPLLDKIEASLRPLLEFCLGVHNNINIEASKTGLLKKIANLIKGETNQHQDIALWAVAARTYYPDGVFDVFEKTDLQKIPFVSTSLQPHFEFKEKWNEWKNHQTKALERSPSWWELIVNLPFIKMVPPNLLYSLDAFQKANSSYSSYWQLGLHTEENIYYWHSIIPQNSDPLALILLRSSCANATYSNQELKGFIRILNQPEFKFRFFSLSVFACCFFQEKKEVRLIASEVLHNLIENKNIDLIALGKLISILINNNYGVFLRLVDALIPLKDSSPLHNSALFLLCDNVIKNLEQTDKLPTNFKKFLETYVDLINKTNEKPSEGTKAFLSHFESSTSLKKLIGQIL